MGTIERAASENGSYKDAGRVARPREAALTSVRVRSEADVAVHIVAVEAHVARYHLVQPRLLDVQVNQDLLLRVRKALARQPLGKGL